MIQDPVWKKSFLFGAIEHKRLVVPVHIDGRNSNKFYNLANFRKRLGVKVNIEMLYLVDEMVKQKGKTVSYTFGEPINPEVFDDRMSLDEWTLVLREYCYGLKDNPDLKFPYTKK